MNLTEYPFTILLIIIGMAIGLTFPMGSPLEEQVDTTEQPGTITGAVIGEPTTMVDNILGALVWGLLLGIAGLIIESTIKGYTENDNLVNN